MGAYPAKLANEAESYTKRILNYYTDTHPRAHTILFLISVLLQWVIYDGMAHSYISRIYQHDKYGVVINYAALSCLTLLTQPPKLSASTEWSSLLNTPRSAHLQGPTQDLFKNRPQIQLAAMTSALKIVLFNFIFKHSTHESDKVKQRTHVLATIALGFVGILRRMNSRYREHRTNPTVFNTFLLFSWGCKDSFQAVVVVGSDNFHLYAVSRVRSSIY